VPPLPRALSVAQVKNFVVEICEERMIQEKMFENSNDEDLELPTFMVRTVLF
jgi:hypothetical protein